jgi:hypothetical protein
VSLYTTSPLSLESQYCSSLLITVSLTQLVKVTATNVAKIDRVNIRFIALIFAPVVSGMVDD